MGLQLARSPAARERAGVRVDSLHHNKTQMTKKQYPFTNPKLPDGYKNGTFLLSK
jgi:hypothetical protein